MAKVFKQKPGQKKKAWYKRKYRLQIQANPKQVANTALKAYSMAKYVSSLLNAEKKYVQTHTTVAVVPGISNYSGHTGGVSDVLPIADNTLTSNSATNIILLNKISRGDNAHERVGDSCKMKDVTIRGDVIFASTEPATARVRLMVVQWKGKQQPHLSAILDMKSDTATAFSVPEIYSYYNKNNAGRLFNVLYDKIYFMARSQPSTGLAIDNAKSYQQFDITCQLEQHVRFPEHNTTNPDELDTSRPSDNKLYFIYLSDVDAVSMVYAYRLNYLDN